MMPHSSQDSRTTMTEDRQTDDFFLSGFYKLYSDEIDDSEDIFLWNHSTTLNGTNNCDLNFATNETQSNDSGDVFTEWNSTLWKPNEELTSEWDLNIENLLFESNFEDSSTWRIPTNLPDKTALCNDSCNIFLKESSENLFLNLQTYHPPADNDNLSGSLETKSQNQNDTEKLFICTYGDCRKIYAKAAHLKAHHRRHIGDKPYVCTWPNCSWKFSRSDELSRHRRSHSGVKPYKCIYCPKCFSRSDHLTKHRKVHERKMAAMKLSTAIWQPVPIGRPGRKPSNR